MTKTKKDTVHGIMCSKSELRVNRIKKRLLTYKKCAEDRLNLIKKYERFINSLLIIDRTSKEELSHYITKKEIDLLSMENEQ